MSLKARVRRLEGRAGTRRDRLILLSVSAAGVRDGSEMISTAEARALCRAPDTRAIIFHTVYPESDHYPDGARSNETVRRLMEEIRA